MMISGLCKSQISFANKRIFLIISFISHLKPNYVGGIPLWFHQSDWHQTLILYLSAMHKQGKHTNNLKQYRPISLLASIELVIFRDDDIFLQKPRKSSIFHSAVVGLSRQCFKLRWMR